VYMNFCRYINVIKEAVQKLEMRSGFERLLSSECRSSMLGGVTLSML
jgi:hypothetical protein